MVVDIDIHRSSDGGLDVRNPHALQLADSVNSEFFAPVDNTLITSRETGGSGTPATYPRYADT